MVFFKMYVWDTHSFFADLSILPQSPEYVFLLLGSLCTVSAAAGKEELRTLFLWIQLGKKNLLFKS